MTVLTGQVTVEWIYLVRKGQKEALDCQEASGRDARTPVERRAR